MKRVLSAVTGESADGPMNTDRLIRWIVFLGAGSAVLSLAVSILRPFAGVIAWSVVLGIVCHPVHQRLVRRTGRVALSAFITSMLTLLACVVPLLLLGAIAVNQGVALAHSWTAALSGTATPLDRIAVPAAWITARLGFDKSAITAWIQPHIGDLRRVAGQYAVSIAGSVLDAGIAATLVFFAVFLLLRESDAIVAGIRDLLPFERQRSEALLGRVKDAVQGTISGVVVAAVLQGVLCGAMLRLLGIHSAALWGMVTMFASLLPVVGAFAVWGPAAAYLAASGQWTRAILLAIWGALVVGGIGSILRPRLVAGRVRLGELAMLFAMLGGVKVFGLLGIVLGPVVFATAAAIVETLRAPQAQPSNAAPALPPHPDVV